jgi:hypothetical protein
MQWSTLEVAPEWLLECVCCGDLVPDENAEVSEWLYILNAYDTPNEEVQAFEKAFEMQNPLADFHVCRECLDRYGQFGENGDPMEWLEA